MLSAFTENGSLTTYRQFGKINPLNKLTYLLREKNFLLFLYVFRHADMTKLLSPFHKSQLYIFNGFLIFYLFMKESL